MAIRFLNTATFTSNVGIGVTSNSAGDTNNGVPKLQVGTTTAVLGEFPLAARFTTNSDAGDNSGVSVLINSGNDRGLMISAGRQSGNVAKVTLNVVENNGTELSSITILQNGSGGTSANVGIRTDSPSSQLSIGANALTTKKPTVAIVDGVAGGSLLIRGLSPILSFDKTSTGVPKILMDTGGLQFKTGTLDAEGDIDMVILPSGNVGIGVVNPSQAKLVVNGNVAFNQGDETMGQINALFERLDFKVEDGVVNASPVAMTLRDYSSGPRMGIGTVNPTQKLQVNGRIYIEQQGTNWNETTPGLGIGALHLDPVVMELIIPVMQ